MSETNMVFSSCVAWLQDWIDADPPLIEDEYDAAQWLTHEMTAASRVFLQNAFHTHHARNDAIMILRALFYEYFLFCQATARAKVPTMPDAPQRLKNAPQTPQKSAAWHHESREMLSGHEFGSIITGGPSEYATILAKKCVPEVSAADIATQSDQNIVFLTPPEGLSPFKWGWRYEDVARDLFEMQFAEGVVYDGLGRVRHPVLPRLGASPDGMITSGPKVGRLVELKCPITRQLNGSIPVNYWVQMQLQAEVCDVRAVEYFEVQLGQLLYDDSHECETQYKEFVRNAKLPWVGKICVVAYNEDDPSNTYRYEYSPLFSSSEIGIIECFAWKPTKGIILESALWWVKDYYNVTVLRNPRWWEEVGKPAYEQFWRDVTDARADGRYERHAVPLFVSDSESETSDHVLSENEDGVGDHTNIENDATCVEGWLGAESDQETSDLEEDAQ